MTDIIVTITVSNPSIAGVVKGTLAGVFETFKANGSIEDFKIEIKG